MKRMHSGGYTIVETIIYLTVASALMTSAMLLISGRQERVRYTQSIATFEQKIKDTLNDVSTGYYPTGNDFRCAASPTGSVSFPTGTQEQGTNTGCVFIGKALELGPGTKYDVYTMAGARIGTSLSNADVKLLGVGGNPGIVDKNQVDVDVDITKIVSLTDPGRNLKGIALVSQFTKTSSVDSKITGNASKVDLYEVPDPFLSNAGKPSMQKADNGVLLCLQQGPNGRKSSLKINNNLTTETTIDSQPAECA